MKKTVSILMTLAMLFALVVMPCVYASDFGTINPVGPSDTSLTATVEKIVGAIRWAGYIVAVVILIYIGIKYIMASASEKADLKGLLIKYVIGAALVVFGTQIAAWVFSIGG